MKQIMKWIGTAVVCLSGITLAACAPQAAHSAKAPLQAAETPAAPAEIRRIRITDTEGRTVVYALNDSSAADSLYGQLPVRLSLKNYSDNEKIFYPQPLDTSRTPRAAVKEGMLAYYAPWQDVVLFYGPYRENDELFALGQLAEGSPGVIASLSGDVHIEKW